MTPRRTADQVSDSGGLFVPVLMVAIAIVAVQGFMILFGNLGIMDGKLIGGDSYMRLNRVIQLWQTGDSFDAVYHRINAPEGHVQHWTRPMDMLLLAGAALGAPLVGFREALHGWAVLVNPLLHLGALIAAVWAAAAVIERRWLWLVGFLFLLQPGIFNALLAARPDHQGLILVVTIVYVGGNLRLLRGATGGGAAVVAGLVGALALWISIETLIPVVLALASLGARWLFVDQRAARTLAVQSTGMAAGILAALLIERGPAGATAVAYDTLSAAHFVLLALNGVAWYLLAGLGTGARDSTLAGRIGYGAALVVVGGVVLWFAYPGFFASPLANVDPLYRTTRLDNIVEAMPMISARAIAAHGADVVIGRAFMWLGQPVVALVWALWLLIRLARRREHPDFAVQWLLPTLGLAAFLPLTVMQVRWAGYLNLFSLLIYAELAATLLALVTARLPQRRLALVRPLLVVALILWSYAPLAFIHSRTPEPFADSAVAACDYTDAARHLADPDGLGATPKQVLAFVDAGPELLYRTPHSVLSIPNHRPQAGYRASYLAMTETDFAAAERILRSHQVDLVLVCNAEAIRGYYGSREPPVAERPTLHEALLSGRPPAFLVPLDWPPAAGADFRLYRLTPQG